ncbi:bifunctional [glutamate--ammonia ligase]-adenylyl-L-tyrosine phosphorylase/[glutamate--ammonia-ligase] adenylyltransferase [Brachymonas denitrificans]|uniref:bifunctional [glutamate--ammonia ligase]-adenylyl-L-tyrosine phosphorylase/[glutamate--ammonia-ligase] adenylyltransferase n=1 Tax=Brachymonas denitrificans TaxID=28220 RepID=UPI00321F8198
MNNQSNPLHTPQDTLSPAAAGSPDVVHPVTARRALHSRFVQRLHRRYEKELPLLAPGLPDREAMRACYQTLRERGLDVGGALRVLRQLVMERLAVLDCDGGETMPDIALSVTWLAEMALDIACNEAFGQLDARFGAPLKPDGTRCNLWIMGMGKLGARELNVSSDIDLIYIYECDGETGGRPGPDGQPSGAGRTSFHEYFTRAVKIIYALVGETTEHGFVFRVDLALRPNGNSGPTVSSLDALEEYLMVQGREWERFAWMKSRCVAPRSSIEDGSGQALRNVVLPFVFRRYLDYNVFESLRVLHRQIRDHAAKRSAGRPERANDVKLSRGGIREIEFTVQLLQVVRGGQFPELRTRPTLEALERVARAGLMTPEIADELAEAYTFLRRVEHRIQYLDDQQTHLLPTNEDDLEWIAHTMGYESACPFLQDLMRHRELVAREFDALLGGDNECKGCQKKGGGDIARSADDIGELTALLAATPALAQRVEQWRDHARVQALRLETRARLMRLMQRTVQWLHEDGPQQGVTTEGVLRFIDWIETLLRRESYLAMLLERPAVHERLLRLLGVAKWPARYLIQHPAVIDELTSNAMLEERFSAADFQDDLRRRIESLQSTGEDDEESLLNLLRRAMHAETFRTLARDLDGRLTVEQVADDLSALADAVLAIATRWCWQRYLPRARKLGWSGPDDADIADRFAIIAYGKLGGLELGYGSDLDLVFVYEDDCERAGEVYAGLVRKLISWLTVKTGEGDLYEIDTELRPNGNSGLLSITLDAFEAYQLQRGSNTAWVWEHQAMTRARCCFGSARLRAHFERIRSAVLTAERDPAALADEIIAMRRRMGQAHPAEPGVFELKHSHGGMIDVEFVTQYLVLLHSREHPAMIENRGNIALLERADDLDILPGQVGHAAATAYRELRRMQHRARLDEESTVFPEDMLQSQADAGRALWREVFGAPW